MSISQMGEMFDFALKYAKKDQSGTMTKVKKSLYSGALYCGEKLMDKFSKTDARKWYASDEAVLNASACVITSCYIAKIMMDKDIPVQQKPAMVISEIMTLGLSLFSSNLVSKKIPQITTKKICENLKDKMPEAKTLEFAGQIENFVKMVAITTVFRFLGPVVSAPISTKIREKMQDVGWLPKYEAPVTKFASIENSKDKQADLIGDFKELSLKKSDVKQAPTTAVALNAKVEEPGAKKVPVSA